MADSTDQGEKHRPSQSLTRARDQLLETMIDAVIALDELACITFCNSAAERLYGCHLPEVIGKPLSNVYEYNCTRPEDERVVWNVVNSQGWWRGEEIHITRGGRQIDVQSTVNVIPQELGGGTVWVMRNVTEWKKAENSLREDRERYAAALELELQETKERHAFIMRLTDSLRALSNPVQIQTTACRMLGERLKASRVLYAEINGDTAIVHPDYVDGVSSIAGTFKVQDFGGDLVQAYLRDEWINMPNIGSDDRLPESVRRAFAAVEVCSNLSRGLLKEKSWVAAIAVHQASPRAWSSLEVSLVQETAERTWDSVQRARAEEALRSSRDSFRHLVEESPFGIYAVNADFELVQVSKGAEKVFAHVRPLLGRDFAEILRVIWPEPFASEAIGRFRNTLETGEPYSAPRTVEQRRDIDGVEAYDWRTERVTLPDGRPGVVCHFYDLSERLRYEAELQHSEGRFRSLAETVPLLVWSSRPDGQWDYLSGQWLAYTAIPEEQQLGYGWLRELHPDDASHVQQRWQACIESGDEYDVEFRLLRHDGVYRWFKTRASPQYHGGEIVKWFGSCTDIDDQKRTEGALRRANSDLEQFAYSASHDLQEPLRTVALYAEILETSYGPQLDDEANSFLRRIVDGSLRMRNLVSDLLSYTQAGMSEDAVETAESDKILASVLGSLEAVIRACGAIVVHDVVAVVPMRPSHLQQLLQNLVGNALKYRTESERPAIHVTAKKDGQMWLFSVSDNGIGIEPDYHRQVFGVFKRLHSGVEQYAGTGMGLAICQKIVDTYGGRIWVESQLGKGSTFYFTVPPVS